MNKKKLNLALLLIVTTVVFNSCGIPKETLQHIKNGKKEMIDFPIDYCNLFPSLTFDQYLKDYYSYNRFLSSDIMRTQAGLSFMNKGVQVWWCTPSARTHVQLDTSTMINDSKAVIGEWRAVCNRRIIYSDSCVYTDRTIYRDSKIIYDEKDEDIFLVLTDKKFKMYGAKNKLENFKKNVIRNYYIENKRFLLLYRLLKAGSSVSFIGIDKEGRLIINYYTS